MSHCIGTVQMASFALLGAGTMYGPPPVQFRTGLAGESVPEFGDAANADTTISAPMRAISEDLTTACSSHSTVVKLPSKQAACPHLCSDAPLRSEEHTSELQSPYV